MNAIFHITDGDDFYEVTIRNSNVVRISRYWDSHRRQDVEFETLSEGVKKKIVDKIVELYRKYA